MKYQTISMFCIVYLCSPITFVSAKDTWRGLSLEEENRCSAYNKEEQYIYPQSIEDEIVKSLGGRVYGPYTGHYYSSDTETDIEHIVATSEGHDSGLCAESAEKRQQFATDLLNLTLAAPKVNRCGPTGKCGFDAGEWLPPRNQCWFAYRIVEIKRKYNLSVDRVEADALDLVLNRCESFEMIFYPEDKDSQTLSLSTSADALNSYDDNKNGRITCTEARKHGIAPVYKTHPAYEFMYDSDSDGVVCEYY